MKTKTKITVAVVSVLSVVALAGTGYAGWVISNQVSQDKTGNVVVYDVTDNSIELNIDDYNGSVVWGKIVKDSALTNGWFGYDNVKDEQFNPTLSFTIKNKGENDNAAPQVTAKVKVIASENDTEKKSETNYEACLNAKLIKGPSFNTDQDITSGLTSVAEGKNGFKYTLNLATRGTEEGAQLTNVFGWGEHFEGKNPINFYNAHAAGETLTSGEKSSTYFDDAKDSLNTLYGLSGIRFQITITADHAKQSETTK